MITNCVSDRLQQSDDCTFFVHARIDSIHFYLFSVMNFEFIFSLFIYGLEADHFLSLFIRVHILTEKK